MNEIELERERVACVFGLGGGELNTPHPDFPDSEGWDGPDGIAHWYNGVPEYATELRDAHEVECEHCGGDGIDPDTGDECEVCDGRGDLDVEVRTAILDCMFGFPEPPAGWERIASFSSSGEASCWWCAAGAVDDGNGNGVAKTTCPLCEGDGLVYIGDGWREVVYASDPTFLGQ